MIANLKFLESTDVVVEEKPRIKRVRKTHVKPKAKTKVKVPPKSKTTKFITYFDNNISELENDTQQPIRAVNMKLKTNFIEDYSSFYRKIKGIYSVDEIDIDEDEILKHSDSNNESVSDTSETELIAISTQQGFHELKDVYNNIIIKNNDVVGYGTIKKVFLNTEKIDNWSYKNRITHIYDFLKKKDLKNKNKDAIFQLDLLYLSSDLDEYSICKDNLLESLSKAKCEVVNSYRNDRIATENLMLKIDRNNIDFFIDHINSNSKDVLTDSFIHNQLVKTLRFHLYYDFGYQSTIDKKKTK